MAYLRHEILPQDDEEARIVLLTIDRYYLDQNDDGDDILRFTQEGKGKICIPPQLRQQALEAGHNVPAAGHLGIMKTYQRVANSYYWPQIHKDVRNYVTRCRACTLAKPPPRKYREALGIRPVADDVWKYVHMDIWGPGGTHRTWGGNRKVLALVDACSKFVVLRAIAHETADIIADVLTQLFSQYGPPEELISDRAQVFTGKLTTQLLTSHGITRRLVIPRHPRANGQVERFFRTLRASLGAIVQELGPEGHDCWDEYLVHVAYAYNTSVHATVGDTPFYLFYGRDPAQNAPFTLDEDFDLLTQNREDAIRHTEAARWTAIQKANEVAYKNRQYYNRRANPQTINVGDKVFVECPTPPHAPNPKLLRKYDGPYIVHEVGIHKITLRTHCGRYQKEVHRDKLRPSFEPEGPYEDEPDDDDDGDGDDDDADDDTGRPEGTESPADPDPMEGPSGPRQREPAPGPSGPPNPQPAPGGLPPAPAPLRRNNLIPGAAGKPRGFVEVKDLPLAPDNPDMETDEDPYADDARSPEINCMLRAAPEINRMEKLLHHCRQVGFSPGNVDLWSVGN